MNTLLTTWQPTASLEKLRFRSQFISQVRNFFAERQVLEVETPILGFSTATDPYLNSFVVCAAAQDQQPLKKTPLSYLQTSPEFPMKRLLAAGSGSIYQISKAFRAEESGYLHNPEFTLLEWYRVGFNHSQLMDEIDELMQMLLLTDKAQHLTYSQVFQAHLALDPLRCSLTELQNCALQKELLAFKPKEPEDRDFWLQLLLTHCIEPHLGQKQPVFLTDFPVSQAALAQLSTTDPLVAERFELYYQGIELANGYHELIDAQEQRQRFIANNKKRQQLGLAQIPLDEHFLNALKAGMPDCSGVALGLDRLIMLACGAKSIAEIISFTFDRV